MAVMHTASLPALWSLVISSERFEEIDNPCWAIKRLDSGTAGRDASHFIDDSARLCHSRNSLDAQK